MAEQAPNAGSGIVSHERDSCISVDTDVGIIRIECGPYETIRDLKLKLQSKGYPISTQRFIFRGQEVADGDNLHDFNNEIYVLSLNRMGKTAPTAVAQSQSGHSYNDIEAEDSAEQYMGNIGVLNTGRSFGSHKYDKIRAKGQSLQVLGNMASFLPNFGSRNK
ncbi:hypothetical protein H2201_004848 [Coniosporium apollinis]|uniref:Ubiquitin-like domain-containing protein n=1 Tax=Coniosporium apollinis TaxID=61459 RepID=A0ABQ9NUP9_9PEZI|nr:hypothetical protein H2201_004848 [Coniosporium apollinis]